MNLKVRITYFFFKSGNSKCISNSLNVWGRDAAQLLQCQTGTLLMQVRFPGAARDFSPRVNFQCRLSYDVHTPTCVITYINICAHIKDPVVHVRVWLIMETKKHPVCTVDQVAWLCCSWLSPKTAPQISQGRNPNGTTELKKEKESSWRRKIPSPSR